MSKIVEYLSSAGMRFFVARSKQINLNNKKFYELELSDISGPVSNKYLVLTEKNHTEIKYGCLIEIIDTKATKIKNVVWILKHELGFRASQSDINHWINYILKNADIVERKICKREHSTSNQASDQIPSPKKPRLDDRDLSTTIADIRLQDDTVNVSGLITSIKTNSLILTDASAEIEIECKIVNDMKVNCVAIFKAMKVVVNDKMYGSTNSFVKLQETTKSLFQIRSLNPIFTRGDRIKNLPVNHVINVRAKVVAVGDDENGISKKYKKPYSLKRIKLMCVLSDTEIELVLFNIHYGYLRDLIVNTTVIIERAKVKIVGNLEDQKTGINLSKHSKVTKC